MRALSWREPFATLMLHDKIETRTWNTNYRGLVLICVSKKPYGDIDMENISGHRQTMRIINELKPYDIYTNLGNAIAVGELVYCRPMTLADDDACFVQYRLPWEEERKRKDGNIKIIKKQLYCHIYKNVRPIEPIPFKGKQGWSPVSLELEKSLKYI